MKILQFCSKVPNPPLDGGTYAMNSLTNGLIDLGADVEVFAISTNKHPFDEKAITLDYRTKTNIETVFVDTSVNLIAGLKNLFSRRSYNISRFYSHEVEKALIQKLRTSSYDIIQLETLFVTPYVETIRKFSKAKIVLRSHNLEYIIWERRVENTRNVFVKYYLKLLAKRLKIYEIAMLNKYDGIAAITPGDADYFRKLGCVQPVITIPFGIDLKTFKVNPEIKQEFPSCFHIGAMNWNPNIEGVRWFLNNVWKLIEQQQLNIKLYLAGRSMPDWLMKLDRKNIQVVGEVKNQFEFMQSKGIMIVPLLSGGGMRIKIIEGMATCKTIISTSIGAEGIPYEHKKNILIADTPQEFVDCINLCINDTVRYQSVGENARKLISGHFDNGKICADLLTFYSGLLNS